MALMYLALNPSPSEGYPTNPTYAFDLVSSLHGPSCEEKALKLSISSFKEKVEIMQ